MSQSDNEANSQSESLNVPNPPVAPEVKAESVLPINQTPPESSIQGTTLRFSEPESNIAQFSRNSDN
jgi:hypothetical protein